MERETGIEPATNSLEGCDSTTELLPPSRSALRRGRPAYNPLRPLALDTTRPRLPTDPCRYRPSRWHVVAHLPREARPSTTRSVGDKKHCGVLPPTLQSACANQSSAQAPKRGWWGGEGSNLRSPKAAGLQPAAIDHSATSPDHCPGSGHDIRNQASLRPPSCLRKSRYICTYGIRGFDTSLGDAARFRWSWRRDLNPRPADYKSAALPD